jgi:hypothetical protein
MEMPSILLRHGQRIRPAYAPPEGRVEGKVGVSTDEQRSDGRLDGVVKRLKKNEEATSNSLSLGWIKATYRDAIEYTGMKQELHGALLYLCVLIAVPSLIGTIWPLWFFHLPKEGLNNSPSSTSRCRRCAQ